MAADPRRRALIALLAVLVAVGVWQWAGTGAPVESVAAAARRAAAPPPAPPADVRLEDLGRPQAPPDGASRNPFTFGARPVVAAPAAPRRESAPTAPVVFAPAGPPPLPPIPFKFIGLVEGAAGARIAVLSDSRGLVVHGGEGAIIDGRFRILAIGAESIDIAYADGRGRQTLRLSGQ